MSKCVGSGVKWAGPAQPNCNWAADSRAPAQPVWAMVQPDLTRLFFIFKIYSLLFMYFLYISHSPIFFC